MKNKELKKTKNTKTDIQQIIPLLEVVFIIILLSINVFVVYYIVSNVFSTQPTKVLSTTKGGLTPTSSYTSLNKTLFDQISSQRSSRLLYNSSAVISPTSIPNPFQ